MSQDDRLRDRILAEASKAVVGRESTLELMLIALLAGGHVLLEGVPGTAKTLMAKTLARLVQAQFARVQFTPDLMPSDVVGTSVVHGAVPQAFTSARWTIGVGTPAVWATAAVPSIPRVTVQLLVPAPAVTLTIS